MEVRLRREYRCCVVLLRDLNSLYCTQMALVPPWHEGQHSDASDETVHVRHILVWQADDANLHNFLVHRTLATADVVP